MIDLDQLVRRTGQLLYCATKVGGCGEPLIIVNGLQRRPHFRHHAGTTCTLSGDQEARDRYTHRIIQNALTCWLTALGYQATAETHLSRRSRVDIHCKPATVIEVQLSAETTGSMLERSDRYGLKTSWLFGTEAGITSRDFLLDRDGAVRVVRVVRCEPRDQFTQDSADVRHVEIGVWHIAYGDTKEATDWYPLQACTFNPDNGVIPPGYRTAIASIAEERKQAEETRRALAAEAERQAQEEAEQRRQAAALLAERADVTRAGPPGSGHRDGALADNRSAVDAAIHLAARLRTTAIGQDIPDLPRTRPTVKDLRGLRDWEARFHRTASPSGPWKRALTYDPSDYMKRTAQIDPGWASGLSSHLIDPAWGALYHTMVYQSGPLAALTEPNVDPDQEIISRLRDLGLIAVTSRDGNDHYETAHDLRHVGTPLQWEQPPPWSGQSTVTGTF